MKPTTMIKKIALVATGLASLVLFGAQAAYAAPSVHISITPSAQTVEATSAAGATATYSISATSGSSISCDHASGSVFPITTTTVVCTAVKGGSSDSDSATVTVRDTKAPVITLTGSATVGLHVGDAYVEQGATATDIVDGKVSVSISGDTVNIAKVGTYKVKYTATDAHHNTSSVTRTVTVSDITPPVISGMPSDMTITTHALIDLLIGTSVRYDQPTALDDVDGDVSSSISCRPRSGSLFTVGETTKVTCTAFDRSGNHSSMSFNVTVVFMPTVTVTLSSATVPATSAAGAVVNYTVTAKGSFNRDLPTSCTPFASGSVFPLGSTKITCTAKDIVGEEGSGSATVTVADMTNPVITMKGSSPITIAVGSDYVDTGATASDNVDDAADITSRIVTVNPVNTSIPDIYTVTYNVTDNAGHSASQVSRIVNVTTDGAPIISGHENITVPATSKDGAVVTYEYPTVEAVPPYEIVCEQNPNTTFPIGDTTVKCTAKDSDGNIGTSGFIVTVQDTTAPVVTITLPEMPAQAEGPDGAIVTYEVTATDWSDLMPRKMRDIVEGDSIPTPIYCNPASGSMFGFEPTTVECSARDIFGNLGTSTAVVTVVDTTAPEFTTPKPQTFEATGTSTTPLLVGEEGGVLVPALAKDLVDPNPILTYEPHDFLVGATTTVTWVATDWKGNAATTTSSVTAVDTTAPVITLTNVPSSDVAYGANFKAPTATATDIVDGDVSVVAGGKVDTWTPGTYVLTYDATDAAGNKAEQQSLTFVVVPAPSQNGGGNGGNGGGVAGGGVVSGPLSFGYQAPLPPAPQAPEEENNEQTSDGDNGDGNNGVAGAQTTGNGGAQPAGAAGSPLGMVNGFQGTGAQGQGGATGSGSPASGLAAGATDNGQAAAVSGAVSGFHFPGWAQLLALLAVLAGFGLWFFNYRRKNA